MRASERGQDKDSDGGLALCLQRLQRKVGISSFPSYRPPHLQRLQREERCLRRFAGAATVPPPWVEALKVSKTSAGEGSGSLLPPFSMRLEALRRCRGRGGQVYVSIGSPYPCVTTQLLLASPAALTTSMSACVTATPKWRAIR